MATDARPELAWITKAALDFSSRASRSLFPGITQLGKAVSLKNSKKRKRHPSAQPTNSSQNSSSVADSLSTPTPVSQSPPRSDNEGERQYPSVLNVNNNKRPRLGRQYQKGMRISKHFPGEGWFHGEITKSRWCSTELQYIYRVEYEDRDREIMSEEQIATVINQDEVDDSVYPFEVFNTLWEKLDPESIEKSALIRKANNYFEIKDTGTKFNAQYGRMLPGSTDMIFQIMRLRRDDLFLDIGHGIGNSCLQAAYTRGCEARGIEVIDSRFEAGLRFQEALKEMALQRDAMDGKIRHIGKIDFKLGDLTDEKNHNWIVKANKVFVNNFNGVFAERSSQSTNTEWHLDHYIGGLFASMSEGSVMCTLSDLNLGPSQSEANRWREDNGLTPSPNASFFEVKKVLLGEAGQMFSWSTSCKTPAYAFVYKRVKQDPNLRGAVLLCSNKDCENAVKGTPVPATAINQLGKCVVGSCGCKMSLRSNRRISHMKFYDFIDGDFI